MKKFLSQISSILILVALFALSLPTPALAAHSITSVVPSQVVNDVSTTITVNGSGFSAGSAVVLLNGSALATNLVNDSVITATVPAGTPAGLYTIAVSNGVEADVECVNCLTVNPPPPPTSTPLPTATTVPLPFVRPQLVVNSTSTTGAVQTNGEFKLKVAVENAGSGSAYGVQAVLSSTDLVPLKTGGVSALGDLGPNGNVNVVQQFLVTGQIYGQSIVVVDLTLTYYDDKGTSYSDKFTLSITASGGVSGGVAAATTTPTGVKSSQLVITGYQTDVDPLQPGEQFALKLNVQNVGNEKAQRITMIVGGGSSGGGGGTPQPGGVSGGGGDFANFAPVGASNVQSLGDLAAGEGAQAIQSLIVNVSTNPGAYPIKITFSYLNSKGEVINDEQVITLLVYSLPNLDVSFYRPPDPFFAGQGGALPIQVVNLGKRTAVMGNIKITSANGIVDGGTGLVGSLDAGGYFTLDAFFTPDQVGTSKLEITIDYTDDFNQARTVTKTIEVEVQEQIIEEFPPEGGGGGGEFVPEVQPETFLQKVGRFILGFLGLDSAPPSNSGGEFVPVEGETFEAVPVEGGGKGTP